MLFYLSMKVLERTVIIDGDICHFGGPLDLKHLFLFLVLAQEPFKALRVPGFVPLFDPIKAGADISDPHTDQDKVIPEAIAERTDIGWRADTRDGNSIDVKLGKDRTIIPDRNGFVTIRIGNHRLEATIFQAIGIYKQLGGE